VILQISAFKALFRGHPSDFRNAIHAENWNDGLFDNRLRSFDRMPECDGRGMDEIAIPISRPV